MAKNPNISVSFQSQQFQAETKKMADSLKTVQKEFKLSDAALKLTGENTDRYANKLGSLSKQLEIQQGISSKTREAVAQAGKAQESAAAIAEKAKTAYEQAAQAEGASAEQLDKLKKEAELSAKAYEKAESNATKWNHKLIDSTAAEKKLEVAIKQTNEELKNHNFENIAKDIKTFDGALNTVARTAAIVAATLAAAGGAAVKLGMDAVNYVDEIATSADKLGVSTTALQRYRYVAMQTDVTDEALAKSIVKLNGDIGNLARGLEDTGNKSLLTLIGNFKNANGQIKDSEQVFLEVVEALSSIEDKAIRAGYANAVFGERFASDLNPLLNQSAEAIREYVKEFENVGYISEDNIKKFTEVDNQINRVSQTLQVIKTDVAIDLMPLFDEFLKTIIDNKDEIKDFAVDGIKGIADLARTVYDLRGAIAAAVAVFAVLKTSVAITSGILAIQKAMDGVTAATNAAKAAQVAYNAVALGSPWGLLAVAIGAVTAGILAYNLATGAATNETDELVAKTKELTEEYEKSIKTAERSSNAQLGEVYIANKLAGELEELSKKVNKTTEDKNNMASIVDQLNQKIPDLSLAINAETGELNKQISVVYDSIEAFKQLLFVQSAAKAASAASDILYSDLNPQKAELEKQLKRLDAEYSALDLPTTKEASDRATAAAYYDELVKANSILTQRKKLQEQLESINDKIVDAEKKIQDSFDMSSEYASKYGSSGSTGGTTEDEELKKRIEEDRKRLEEEQKKRDVGKAATEAEKARQEAIVKAFGDLKFSRDMDEISEAEYYKKLEVLRDKYFKKGSSDWQNYTVILKDYQETLFNDRRAESDRWIAEQKFYGKLSSDEEIAAYERIRTYVTEYYKSGVIDYAEYLKQIRELDKNTFTARKIMIEDAVKSTIEAEKEGLDRRKTALAEEEKAIKSSYDKRKQEIENYYDEIEQKEKQQDRAEKLDELLKEEEKYQNAATKEGKDRLKRIQDEIKAINRETEKELRDTEKKKELSKAEAERDRLEEERLRKLSALDEDYKRLDTAQKAVLDNISNYATVSADAIEQVTKKIQDMVQALANVKVPSLAVKQTGVVSSGGTNIILNDSGVKNFYTKQEALDYAKELANTTVNAIRGGLK